MLISFLINLVLERSHTELKANVGRSDQANLHQAEGEDVAKRPSTRNNNREKNKLKQK